MINIIMIVPPMPKVVAGDIWVGGGIRIGSGSGSSCGTGSNFGHLSVHFAWCISMQLFRPFWWLGMSRLAVWVPGP